jgi:hypothetical protein
MPTFIPAMRYILTFLFALWLSVTLPVYGQSPVYKAGVIGFYNVENLFDTIKGANMDDEFLPTGANRYTGAVYLEKLQRLSTVISQLGKEFTSDGVSILGLAEVENRAVLEDLVKQPLLRDKNFQIIHFDSPDFRGVDVAMIYQAKYFRPLTARSLFVDISKPGDTSYTRDILYVSGLYDGEPLHIFVNHWPSRRGGEAATRPLREKAAAVCKAVIDSLMAIDPATKVIVMGDLNDDPINSSVKNVLQARGTVEETCLSCLYNPWEKLFKKGIGTLAWQDAWGLFDQIIISGAFLDQEQEGFYYVKPEVFNRKFLVQKSGKFKGYPFRTYVGNNYMGGYSDHFPTLLYFLKRLPGE